MSQEHRREYKREWRSKRLADKPTYPEQITRAAIASLNPGPKGFISLRASDAARSVLEAIHLSDIIDALRWVATCSLTHEDGICECIANARDLLAACDGVKAPAGAVSEEGEPTTDLPTLPPSHPLY